MLFFLKSNCFSSRLEPKITEGMINSQSELGRARFLHRKFIFLIWSILTENLNKLQFRRSWEWFLSWSSLWLHVCSSSRLNQTLITSGLTTPISSLVWYFINLGEIHGLLSSVVSYLPSIFFATFLFLFLLFQAQDWLKISYQSWDFVNWRLLLQSMHTMATFTQPSPKMI